ncbi:MULTISPECIES: cyanase [Deinococcus]|uniref:Cyanate hydratase n=1 Tax=Deinococcus rufus TaxID=2136097 RepID=A0ABV7Z5V5_9DEIO|nr:cyanase [Deinococcus sp. AB2017081]WQE96379.1 cyanase [Deinococcus sp. AB2017081]
MTTTTVPTPTRPELLAQLAAARHERRLTLAELAAQTGTDRVWLAAALDGQHPMPLALAQTLLRTLGLDPAHAPALTGVPMRGAFQTLPPTDPTLYRLYEVLQVYGPALKTLIHEEFGDGIMSAINFRLELHREPHPDGDRVVITMAGKYLPYHWASPEP